MVLTSRSSRRKHNSRPRVILAAVTVALACVLMGSPAAVGTQTDWAYSERAVENLWAFARLYGIVRWFHPSDEAAVANWSTIALQGVRVAYDAEDPYDLAERLQSLFSPYAPTVRVFAPGESIQVPGELAPPESHAVLYVVQWSHEGVGTAYSVANAPTIYWSVRERSPLIAERLPSGMGDPEHPLQVDLGEGLTALVATTLYADRERSFPSAEATGSLPEIPQDRVATLLADAIVMWNVIQHFDPVRDLAEGGSWTERLAPALQNILMGPSTYSYEDLSADLLVPLRDGHARLS